MKYFTRNDIHKQNAEAWAWMVPVRSNASLVVLKQFMSADLGLVSKIASRRRAASTSQLSSCSFQKSNSLNSAGTNFL